MSECDVRVGGEPPDVRHVGECTDGGNENKRVAYPERQVDQTAFRHIQEFSERIICRSQSAHSSQTNILVMNVNKTKRLK